MTVNFLQEHTIPGARVFDNRCPQADAFHELAPQLTWRYLQEIRDYLNLGPGDPYISLAGPGAAPPALHALKMKPANIPGSFLSIRRHDLPLQYRAGVGAGGHRGILCKAALGYFGFWSFPSLFALGQFIVRKFNIDFVVRDVNFYDVTVF